MIRGLMLGVAAAALLETTSLSAQQAADGHPDLQGFWSNSTATPLERPEQFADQAYFTPEEAAQFERGGRDRILAFIPKNEQQTAGDLDPAYLEVQDFKVLDTRRTSLIVDPADGKLPPPVDGAKKRVTAPPERSYDGPEGLTLDERCLISTGFLWSLAAPPMVGNPFGGNYYQVVQTSDYVMILAEGVHDARIIRIGGTHLPVTMRQWLGDSVGRWEDETLVVDTINFTAKSQYHGSSGRLHVVERFTRVDADTLGYQATVDDPGTWTAPWTVDSQFKTAETPVLEYACHEANYSLGFSLRGTRAAEAEAAAGR